MPGLQGSSNQFPHDDLNQPRSRGLKIVGFNLNSTTNLLWKSTWLSAPPREISRATSRRKKSSKFLPAFSRESQSTLGSRLLRAPPQQAK
jgi:hypothetical protein